MSQILSAEELIELKEVIFQELDLANNSYETDNIQRLMQGFAAKRGDFSLFEEKLIRKVITGNENGKLPSEQLRELIIKNTYLLNQTNDNLEIKRNAVGSIYLNFNEPSPLLLTVDAKVTKFKKTKVKYTFDINFKEFVINVDNTNAIIEELRDQIETLKNQVSILESDKNNIRTSIVSVELDNEELKKTIEELQLALDETVGDIQSIEISKQEEIIKIQQEAQVLIENATQLLASKDAEFNDLKSKIELIFLTSTTYDDIIEKFKKIGVGL